MDKCQKILCSVANCVHNAKSANHCNLDSIQVSPSAKNSTGNPHDDTSCASYKTDIKL